MRAQIIALESLHKATFSIILLIGLLLASGAQAQSLAEKEAKLDALYEQLLQNPADVDTTLAYSELAVELGDYEAAIPPLERLLIQNPGAHKIKLELGVLYYLLGSFDMARTYLGEVAAAPDADEKQKAQAQSYLSRM